MVSLFVQVYSFPKQPARPDCQLVLLCHVFCTFYPNYAPDISFLGTRISAPVLRSVRDPKEYNKMNHLPLKQYVASTVPLTFDTMFHYDSFMFSKAFT